MTRAGIDAVTVELVTLTPAEALELAGYEQTIKRGLSTFVEVGTALLSIRVGKLYRQEYGTFEDYCRERWGIARNYANKLISAAEVVVNLGTVVPILPSSESQARPLTGLSSAEQLAAWQMAVETAPNGKVTAAHVEAVVEQHKNGNGTYRHVSDDSYEWYTPGEYIAAARKVMGEIDLDPASSEEAQEVIAAAKYYTKEQDGLVQTWQGRVWLNPPYCMPDIELFVDKAIGEYMAGNVKQAVILTNNATDTAWFHRLLEAAGVVCLTRGRVKFWGPNSSAARQGQVIFYLGKRADKFVSEFSQFGAVVKLA